MSDSDVISGWKGESAFLYGLFFLGGETGGESFSQDLSLLRYSLNVKEAINRTIKRLSNGNGLNLI